MLIAAPAITPKTKRGSKLARRLEPGKIYCLPC